MLKDDGDKTVYRSSYTLGDVIKEGRKDSNRWSWEYPQTLSDVIRKWRENNVYNEDSPRVLFKFSCNDL